MGFVPPMDGCILPNQSPSVYQRSSRKDLSVEDEARRLARRVLEDWTHSGSQDSKTLVDNLQRAFLEEANHALRQVLFQLGARVELALVKNIQGESIPGNLDERTASSLMDALTRAAKIVDIYLDRSKAVQYAIMLHPEPFRLDQDIHDMLKWNGFLDEPRDVELDLKPATVVADRERLRDVLGHLVARFWFSRTGAERLVVRLHPTTDGGAQGFIGFSTSPLHAEDLIEEINHPLSIEAIEIDIPYTRAILERHGGTLFVASGEGETIGFGFSVPREPEQENKEVEHFVD